MPAASIFSRVQTSTRATPSLPTSGILCYCVMMKTSKNKWRRQQQQSGRPVLVTFYVIQPRRVASGSGSRATSSHAVRHHQRQHRRDLRSGGHDERWRSNGGKFPKNRRADLLEYSRKQRALAQQVTTTTSTPPLPPLPAGRQDRDNNTAVAVRGDEGQPAADVNRRLERAMSQQQIRQHCFGGDGWSWKRVLVLIFPTSSNSHSVVGSSKPRRPRRMDDDDTEKNRSNNQKGWPAALLAGKLTVTKSRRDHGGFAKKLRSVFQKRSQ